MHRARAAGVRFGPKELGTLQSRLNKEVWPVPSFMDALEWCYSSAVRFTADGKDVELYDPVAELFLQPSSWLALIPKFEDCWGSYIPVPIKYSSSEE